MDSAGPVLLCDPFLVPHRLSETPRGASPPKPASPNVSARALARAFAHVGAPPEYTEPYATYVIESTATEPAVTSATVVANALKHVAEKYEALRYTVGPGRFAVDVADLTLLHVYVYDGGVVEFQVRRGDRFLFADVCTAVLGALDTPYARYVRRAN